MQGKPFALIGVNINCHDPKTLKKVVDRERLNFRSFTDTAAGEGLGAIGSAWNLFGTPTVFVLDHKGVIRYRQIGMLTPAVADHAKAINEVLKKLIREAQANDRQEK